MVELVGYATSYVLKERFERFCTAWAFLTSNLLDLPILSISGAFG